MCESLPRGLAGLFPPCKVLLRALASAQQAACGEIPQGRLRVLPVPELPGQRLGARRPEILHFKTDCGLTRLTAAESCWTGTPIWLSAGPSDRAAVADRAVSHTCANVKTASPISEAPRSRSTQYRAALRCNMAPMILPIVAQSERHTNETADIVNTSAARPATLRDEVAVKVRMRIQAFGFTNCSMNIATNENERGTEPSSATSFDRNNCTPS